MERADQLTREIVSRAMEYGNAAFGRTGRLVPVPHHAAVVHIKTDQPAQLMPQAQRLGGGLRRRRGGQGAGPGMDDDAAADILLLYSQRLKNNLEQMERAAENVPLQSTQDLL